VAEPCESPSGRPDDPLAAKDPISRLLGVLPRGWSTRDLWGMFEAAPVAYAVFHPEGGQVLANRAYHELFGYDEDELLAIDGTDLLHPEDRATIGDRHLKPTSGQLHSFEHDVRFVRKDGTLFWGHVISSTLRNAEGEPWAVMTGIEDVTDRVAAQAALVANESRFRSLVQNANDAILLVDRTSLLTYASPSIEELVGIDPADYLGSSVLRFVHPEDQAVASQTFAITVARKGVGMPLRMRLLRPDGEVRYVEVLATNLLHDPAVCGIVLNVRDLTDAEQVRTSFEMTENRFRHMLENISDSITLLDRHANVILSTGTLDRRMGYSSEWWAQRNAFDIVHPQDVMELQDQFFELLASPGQETTVEVRLQVRSGDWIDAEITAINLLDDPDVDAIVVTTRNVSEKKQAERELGKAHDQAVQALRLRTEFIASVSHELRTPIHGILGLSELLATADLDEEARGLARSIGRATDTLRMVLDDILDFSKMEVGRLEINEGPVNMFEMADDLDMLFGPQAQAKGIALIRDIAPDFPMWVRSDGLRIRQVLNNLIGNAIKFTAEGEVRIVARRLPRPTRAAPEQMRIAVCDTGIGIPPDAQHLLFEPFSQVHGVTTRDFGGTGLGLWIAKRLIELMGGELGYSSVQGRGSEFWFTLAMVEAAAIEPVGSPAGAAALPGERAGRILVVEDNPINQLLVRRQLERLGYEPMLVDSGVAALELFLVADADLVLMDWQLPGIDGLETTQRLRVLEAECRRSRTPVVAMTASALPGDRQRCMDAGMDDFIAKPVSIATLDETVSRWLDAAAAHERWPALDAVELTTDGRTPSLARSTGRRNGGVPGGPVFDPDDAIDGATLDRLVRELADPALVITVVRTYLRELDGRLTAIETALSLNDHQALAAAAHTLKSTSAAVGAIDLSTRCSRLEDLGYRRPSASPPIDGTELRARARAVTKALEDQVRRLEAAQS
jgi:PAS domain S-box-containing protein